MADIFDELLTEAELAQREGKSVRTLQRRRARREGPPFIVNGATIYYRLSAYREWLLSKEIRPKGTEAA